MSEPCKKLYISMYHYTRDLYNSRYPNIKGLDITQFRKQLEFFSQNFNVVTMEQVIDAVKRKTDLPNNALLLTFDDGYIDNYLYALPLLEEFGFQGSFFIPGKTFTTHQLLDVNKIHYIVATADEKKLVNDLNNLLNHYRGMEFDFPTNEELFEKYAVANRFDSKEIIYVKRVLQTAIPEKVRNLISSDLFEMFVGISETKMAHELYMTEDQIRTMKRHGMFIGAHGFDHLWLSDQDLDYMKKDIDKGLDAINEFIDKDCWVMNYPYGSYNDNVINYVKERGAVIGLTTEVGIADLTISSPYTLPRFDCNDFPPKTENYKSYL